MCEDVKIPSCLTTRPGLPLTSERPPNAHVRRLRRSGGGSGAGGRAGGPAVPVTQRNGQSHRHLAVPWTSGLVAAMTRAQRKVAQGSRGGRRGCRASGLGRGGAGTWALGLRLCSLRRGHAAAPSLSPSPTLFRSSGLHVTGPGWGRGAPNGQAGPQVQDLSGCPQPPTTTPASQSRGGHCSAGSLCSEGP